MFRQGGGVTDGGSPDGSCLTTVWRASSGTHLLKLHFVLLLGVLLILPPTLRRVAVVVNRLFGAGGPEVELTARLSGHDGSEEVAENSISKHGPCAREHCRRPRDTATVTAGRPQPQQTVNRIASGIVCARTSLPVHTNTASTQPTHDERPNNASLLPEPSAAQPPQPCL